jgi:hypothetical protein
MLLLDWILSNYQDSTILEDDFVQSLL